MRGPSLQPSYQWDVTRPAAPRGTEGMTRGRPRVDQTGPDGTRDQRGGSSAALSPRQLPAGNSSPYLPPAVPLPAGRATLPPCVPCALLPESPLANPSRSVVFRKALKLSFR